MVLDLAAQKGRIEPDDSRGRPEEPQVMVLDDVHLGSLTDDDE